jgi:Response regulator of the LytR/AlgR family
MLSAVVIDCDSSSRCALKKLIDDFFRAKIHIIALTSTLEEGIKIIQSHNPSVVFIDVELHNENWMQLLDLFKEGISFEIVITTLNQQYAISAIHYNVFSYLIKPLDKVDIDSVVSKYERKISEKKGIVQNLPLYPAYNYSIITLITQTGIIFLEECYFLYAKASGSYCEIYTIDNRIITISKTLKEFEFIANNNNFIRVHKSFVVNVRYVSELIKDDEYSIVLKTKVKIPLSIRRKESFLNRMTKRDPCVK